MQTVRRGAGALYYRQFSGGRKLGQSAYVILIGALAWEWQGWNLRAPYLIWLAGYLPFLVAAYWVHDMASVRKQAAVAAALTVFGGVPGWT